MAIPHGGAASIWADPINPDKSKIRDWGAYVEERFSSLDFIDGANLDIASAFSLSPGLHVHALSGTPTGGPAGVTIGAGDVVETFVIDANGGHQFLHNLTGAQDGRPQMWMRQKVAGTLTPWIRVGADDALGLRDDGGVALDLDTIGDLPAASYVHKITTAPANAPAGISTGAGDLVETVVWDGTAAVQVYIDWTSAADGEHTTWSRVKSGGVWRPWRANGPGGWQPAIGTDGVIYDAATDGSVAAVETPDFLDGFEYRALIVDATAPANAGLGVQLYYETGASWSPALTITNNNGTGQVHNADVLFPHPRLSRRLHMIEPVGAGGTAAGNNNINNQPRGTGTAAADKVLRAKFYWGSGNIDSGKIILLKRTDGGIS